MPLSTRAKKRLGILAIVLAVFAVARMTFFQSFDRESWIDMGKVKDLHAADGRQKMLLDLVLFHRLKGKTRQELIDLLGPPATGHSLSGYELVYDMGVAPVSITHAWLAFDFEGYVAVDYDWVKK